MNLSCFILYFFGISSFFLLKFCMGVLLDNSSWMRVGELLVGLAIEDGWRPTHLQKKEVPNSQSRDQNYVWRNFKQTSK